MLNVSLLPPGRHTVGVLLSEILYEGSFRILFGRAHGLRSSVSLSEQTVVSFKSSATLETDIGSAFESPSCYINNVPLQVLRQETGRCCCALPRSAYNVGNFEVEIVGCIPKIVAFMNMSAFLGCASAMVIAAFSLDTPSVTAAVSDSLNLMCDIDCGQCDTLHVPDKASLTVMVTLLPFRVGSLQQRRPGHDIW